MGDIITMPGFYTSTAGKCEVKDCDGRFAIGWCNLLPVVWHCGTGHAQRPIEDIHNITGPWVDPPPKRHECWVSAGKSIIQNFAPSPTDELQPKYHMVEKRRGETIVPEEPTDAMVRAGAEAYRKIDVDDPIATAIYRAMIAARPPS